ncbi:MAG: P-loop NTPase [Ilumatobacteraceae bacterium]
MAVHPGVADVRIDWGEMTGEERSEVMLKARWNAREHAPDTEVPTTARVLAIASGKGGVGKSSVTVNLAAAIAAQGFTVGVLDADIWGFSVPRLLGIDDRLEAERVDGSDRPKIVPNERTVGRGVLKVVSTGFLVEEDTALMWRGLMLTKAVEQFLRDVRWGELDYLLIDMPPGTGDVQMGLARMLPRTDLLIVTTPALAAQKVAARAADMARRSFLRVCGVIENMSAFVCDHGESYALFGSGGGQALADEVGVPLLGAVPLEPAVAAGGDAEHPSPSMAPARRRCVPGDRASHRRRGLATHQHGRLFGAPVAPGERGARRARGARRGLSDGLSPRSRRSPARRGA